jgi:4,5-dihydroxyphthalate decarboxylase
MAKLNLTLACWDYDRTRALMDRVQPEGIELNYLPMAVEETFFRMLRHREFDVAELSLSSYCVSLSRGEPPFIAIPVFPSRFFRHSCIFVSAKSAIREPKDLIGKRIGTPEYQMTAPVWIRGVLEDDYGVPVDSVTYVTGGEETPGRDEKLKLDLPPRIKIERAPPGKTLSGMLRSGEIDALHTARAPSCFTDGSGDARRLFEDFQSVERTYFKRTGIFPIMHVIVIRRDIYQAHRWVAQTLMQSFREAQALAYAEFEETAALKIMLPWLLAHLEETRREMGRDFWPYGVEPNRKGLETFLRYHHQQGLSPRKLEIDALFAPEALESFTI